MSKLESSSWSIVMPGKRALGHPLHRQGLGMSSAFSAKPRHYRAGVRVPSAGSSDLVGGLVWCDDLLDVL